MKFKVRSFRHSDGRWESKYIEPKGKVLPGDVVQTRDSYLLRRYFLTKDEADQFAAQFLKERRVKVNEIEIITD